MAEFKYHTKCDKCGSKDNLAVYSDGSYFCFSYCGNKSVSQEWIDENGDKNQKNTKFKRSSKGEDVIDVSEEKEKKLKPVITEEQKQQIKDSTSYDDTGYRGIRQDTYKFFGVRTGFDSDNEPSVHWYPTTQNSELVGYKCRELPKQFGGNIGRTGKECELFGQFRFKQSNSKYCLIVGGEIDTLSAYQMLKDYNEKRGSDFDVVVVSPTIGETGCEKQLAAQYEWFNQFEKIIVGFDNDKAGKEATEKSISALPKGKVYVAHWTHKDPNEYLKNDDERLFISDYYNAEKYVPTGVVGSSQLYDKVLNQTKTPKVRFPDFMGSLNEMFVDGMPLGHIINIAADTGIGKCFAKGTKIRMYDMTVKSVEDIVNGDIVMGDDGTPRVVSGVTSGIDKMYEVSQVKGMTYIVNSAHILSLRSSTDIKSMGITKGEIVNINVEDYLKLPKTHQGYLKGYKADISNYGSGKIQHSYLIGLWLGDGTSAKPQITFGKSEHELLDWFGVYVAQNNWTLNLSPSNDRSGCITLDINGFRDTLKLYNLLNNKHIPYEIFQSNLETRLECLAGFVDADGFLQNGCYTMTLKKNQLSKDIVVLAKSVGLAVTTNDSFKKCQGFEGDIYTSICISGDIAKVPVKLSKRKAKVRSQIKNVMNTGISIRELPVGEYFGFQVDGNHLFCLEDFTVTHNTTLVNEMVYDWIFRSPHKVGIVSMELDTGQYGEVLLSRHMRRKLSLIGDIEEKLRLIASDTVKEKAEELFTVNNEDRFYVLDNRDGSVEEIQETVEQLVIACGCKLIVLDPLQDVLDGLSNEEQAVFMKWAKGFIKSHNVLFIFINHMRKTPAGQQGGDSEQNIMGSSTIIKSASANIILRRDKMAENPLIRNITWIDVTKNRVCGITGPANGVYYENQSHTLHNLDQYLNDNNLKLPEDEKRK